MSISRVEIDSRGSLTKVIVYKHAARGARAAVKRLTAKTKKDVVDALDLATIDLAPKGREGS